MSGSMSDPKLPPVLRLGPVVQLSPEAAWALWHLARTGARAVIRRDGVGPTAFTRDLLATLAEAARHRDTDCRCARQADTTNDESVGTSSVEVLGTAEAAGILGLSPRSVQRKRHEIGGFRRTSSGRLEFDPQAVQAFAQMRTRQREELDA